MIGLAIFDLRNLDGLGNRPDGSNNAVRTVRSLGVSGWFEPDRARAAADPGLAALHDAVGTALERRGGRLVSLDGRLGFYWPRNAVRAEPQRCEQLRGYSLLVVTQSRTGLDRAHQRQLSKSDLAQATGGRAADPAFWKRCRAPATRLLAARPRPVRRVRGGPRPLRPLRSGALLMAASQVATAGTGFLTAIAIARLLGPDGIGDYTIALWLLTLMGAVMSLGLEQGLAWSVSAGRWAPRSAFVQSQLAALALGLIGAAIAVGVRLVAPGAFGGLSVVLVLLTAAAVPFLLSFSYSRWLAVTADRYEAFVAPLPLVSTLTLVLAAGLAIPWEETGMVVGLLAANVLTAAVAFVTAARGLPPKAAAPPDDHGLAPLREATKFGVRANVGTALQFINYRIDLFVLSAVTSSAQLGLYAAAVSVTSVMFLAPQTLAQVVFPRVAALSAGRGGGP